MTDAHLSPVPRDARRYQGQRAGVVSRSVASTIDALVVVAAVVAAYAAVNGILFLADPRGFQPKQLRPLVSITSILVVLTLYLTAAWSTTSRTYGCHIMGLRVIDQRGTPMGPFRAFARATLCVLFPLGLLWSAVSLSRRSLQDVLLRTSVIYDWRPPGSQSGFAKCSPAADEARTSRLREYGRVTA
jgi:uncharacterized RDD family membrane protein YckC